MKQLVVTGVIAASAAALACSSSSSESESTSDESKPDESKTDEAEPEAEAGEASCDARMDRFAASLAPLADSAGGLLMAPPDLTPLESTEGSPVRTPGPAIAVHARGGLSLDGQPIAGIGPQLTEELERRREMMEMYGRVEPVYIWADQRASAATVAKVAEAVPSDLEVRLAVLGPERDGAEEDLAARMKNPKVLALRERIDGADPSRKAVLVAEAIQEAIGLCTPLAELFGSIAAVAPEDKGERVIEGAPRAIRACDCRVADLELIEYTMLSILGAFERPVRWLPAAQAASVLAQ